MGRARLTPFGQLAKISALNPIEVIVLTFILVTLVYFQLLQAVKESDFLNAPISGAAQAFHSSSVSGGVLLQHTGASKWTPIEQEEPALILRQVIISLDAKIGFAGTRGDRVSVGQGSSQAAADDAIVDNLKEPPLFGQLLQLENALRTVLSTDQALEYLPSGAVQATCPPAASLLFPDDQTYVITLGFAAKNIAAHAEWIERLRNVTALHDLFQKASSNHKTSSNSSISGHSSGTFAQRPLPLQLLVDASLDPLYNSTNQSLKDMRSIKWFAYAVRAFILRFYALARKADSADIFVMLIAYLLMHLTFVKLFFNMRKLGSKVWLATSVLVSGTIAFLFALLTAHLLGLAVNPVLLSEALPFLVCTVGFEKPYVLARAVFTSASLAPSASHASSPTFSTRSNRDYFSVPWSVKNRQPNSSAYEPGSHVPARVGVQWATPAPAHEIVARAVSRQGAAIVRDYAIEIAVLCAGGLSGIAGLQDFCRLAALILAYDCLFLFVFYVAILAVMIEVHRIRIMRGLRRQDSSADLARILDDGTTSPPPLDTPSPRTLRQKLVKLTTGVAPGEKATPESPTARLKLLLLSSFLVLHASNLLSTLTASTVIKRHEVALNRVDLTAPSLSHALSQLAALHKPASATITRIASPLHIRLLAPTLPNTVSKAPVPLALLDNFMSAWSRLVGDPVLSKWIVIALGVSVFLNGYLLKGFAVNGSSGMAGEGFAPVSAAEAAARILIASTRAAVGNKGTLRKDEGARARMPRRWSGGVEGLQKMKSEWSLADAAEMAAERRKAMLEEEASRETAMQATTRYRRTSASSEDSESQPPSPILLRPRARRPDPIGLVVSDRPSGHLLLPPRDAKHRSRCTEDSGDGPLSSTQSAANVDESNSASSSSTSATDDIPTPATTIDGDDDAKTAAALSTPRTLDDLVAIFSTGAGARAVSDEEVILLVQRGKVAAYSLEKLLKDSERAVRIRRALISRASVTKTLEASELPYQHYDYEKVIGQCCENVVGYVPLPLGIAGPLRIDGKALPIPMATTEGALVASTSRGCKALNAGGGVTTVLTQDAMTRGPALEFPSVAICATAKAWLDSENGQIAMKAAFNSTSRFARLLSLKSAMAGRTLYVRFATQTGDAMGMNMISKGTERALEMMMSDHFPEMRVVALSGNYCCDKKPAAINWIEGRGKSVVAEGIVPGEVVSAVLKTTVADIVRLNIAKNLVGSALAGSIGGNNAHASNILTAIFLATGQDPAQNVESSNCMTLMEAVNGGQDLLITCTMPSIEVGTIGGGTILNPQGAMLDMLGVRGPHPSVPGDNARGLARIICAAVMAGELSLMSALAAGHLVKSHLALNRSQPVTPSTLNVTGRTFLTPAPSRPGTPKIGMARQASGLALTPVTHPGTPMAKPP